jgi:hypothetical protein
MNTFSAKHAIGAAGPAISRYTSKCVWDDEDDDKEEGTNEWMDRRNALLLKLLNV